MMSSEVRRLLLILVFQVACEAGIVIGGFLVRTGVW